MKSTDTLGKPSLLDHSNLFSNINIAVVDPDVKMAQMVKDILYALGCKHIYLIEHGDELLQLMRTTSIEIIITEWDMKKMSGQDLTLYLRQALDSPSRMVPIIVLTGTPDRSLIKLARDSGVSEFIIKPFSAKTLLERVYSVVEEPRSFVLCKTYTGPDRRRISSLSLPPDPDDDKVKAFVERWPATIVTQEVLKQLILDDIPRIIMPDYTLKKRIGFDIPEELVVSPMSAAQTEEDMAKAQEEFVERMIKDVKSLEEAYAKVVRNPEMSSKVVEVMKEVTFSIKTRGGVFGYIRATEVANQLYNFIARYWDKTNKNHLIILEKHIQTLSVIFNQRISGDGGKIGNELIKDLARLINRYHKKED